MPAVIVPSSIWPAGAPLSTVSRSPRRSGIIVKPLSSAGPFLPSNTCGSLPLARRDLSDVSILQALAIVTIVTKDKNARIVRMDPPA